LEKSRIIIHITVDHLLTGQKEKRGGYILPRQELQPRKKELNRNKKGRAAQNKIALGGKEYRARDGRGVYILEEESAEKEARPKGEGGFGEERTKRGGKIKRRSQNPISRSNPRDQGR